eukprot:scaffold34567_cov66-Cyclotella_meneghiniana.AAC.4
MTASSISRVNDEDDVGDKYSDSYSSQITYLKCNNGLSVIVDFNLGLAIEQTSLTVDNLHRGG